MRKFTEMRSCLACGRNFVVDLMRRWMVLRMMCSDKCRKDAHLQHKREKYEQLNPRPFARPDDVDIHAISHEARVEYYAKRYAAGLDPLTGRRLSRTQDRHPIAFDIRSSV